MDAITGLALSVDDPVIRAVGMLLQDTVVYVAILLGLMLIGEQRDDKRKKIIFSLVLVTVLVFSIKYALALERPCVGSEWCPDDYSFPSAHAAAAFTLMTAYLNKRSYPLYLLFALFVCFTRLNIGVHTFYDVAGALPLALLSYYVTDVLWEGRR